MGQITGLAGDAQGFVTTLSLDAITIITLFVILLILGMRMGKSFLANFLLSIYVAGFLFLKFPMDAVGTVNLGLLLNTYDIFDLIIFVVLAGIMYVIVDYMLEFEFSGNRIKNMFSSIILAASGTIGLIGILYATRIAHETSTSWSVLNAVFSNNLYLFGLLILPLVGLFIVVR